MPDTVRKMSFRRTLRAHVRVHHVYCRPAKLVGHDPADYEPYGDVLIEQELHRLAVPGGQAEQPIDLAYL